MRNLRKNLSSKIVTDSRKISKGDCFLALKGPNFNGHDFIDEALDRSLFVISEKNHPQDKKILGVNSTHECLSFLAKHQRKKFEGKVVGITGSNGKTSTKLLLSSILSDKFDPSQIYVSPGNWNNFYGLCFSLLELKNIINLEFLEIGTNDFGEINRLSSILQPEVGVITSIGKAHLEKLINLEELHKRNLIFLKMFYFKELVSSQILMLISVSFMQSHMIKRPDPFLAMD